MGSGQYRGTCGGVADKAMKLLLSLCLKEATGNW